MTTPHVLVVGGGQIGAALTAAAVERNCRVTIVCRSTADWSPSLRRRSVHMRLAGPMASIDRSRANWDLAVYAVPDADRNLPDLGYLAARARQVVLISTIDVYRDGAIGPLTETSPVVEPCATSRPGRRRTCEELVLNAGSSLLGSVIRTSGVYGLHSARPRELFFVERARDGRDRVVIADEGRNGVLLASAPLIAGVAFAMWESGLDGVYNVVDPVQPDVCEIGRSVYAALGRQLAIVKTPGPPHGCVGDTPWTSGRPARPCTASATVRALTARVAPAGYAANIVEVARQLDERLRARRIADAFPEFARRYPVDFFDYAREDAYLRGHEQRSGSLRSGH